ncbi:hypothetical protein AADG42_07005 [Ammonicoccus fulvus]|uniref:Uncharacterized protein n=1 Tax=Ammonicoccus fulvus TaxID=3138240 RepID=A0ABZ3FQM9_9ACTN
MEPAHRRSRSAIPADTPIGDAVMSRRALKWGIPAVLLAAPYLAAVKLLTDHSEYGGPGWLHLVVLLCAWSALKMLWLGRWACAEIDARLRSGLSHR